MSTSATTKCSMADICGSPEFILSWKIVLFVQGLLPNANESAVINVLTNGQFDAIALENTSLPRDFLLPPTPVPEELGLPPLRRKRQAETGLSCDLECVLA